MQARIGKFDKVTRTITGYEMLSVFGKMTGVCKSVSLRNTEYVTDLALDYDEAGVNRILFKTSQGQILGAGTASASTFSVTKEVKFTD